MKSCLYGLEMRAADEGDLGSGRGRADVTLHLGELGPFASLTRHAVSTPVYRSTVGDEAETPDLEVRRLPGGAIWCVYADGTEVVVDPQGTRVYATWVPPATRESTLGYLKAHFLGLVLRLRGVTCLHGSVVAVGEQAIILVGRAGAGKSTTAATLVQRGYPMLADDIAALEDRQTRFLVHPGYPNLQLLPNSVRALWGAPNALPPPELGGDKHSFDPAHPEFRVCNRPMPVGAVYVLGPRNPGRTRPAFAPLSGTKGLLRLVANTSCGRLLDPALKIRELETLGRLMRRVPVRQLEPPRGLEWRESLCDGILDDCRSLGLTLHSPSPGPDRSQGATEQRGMLLPFEAGHV